MGEQVAEGVNITDCHFYVTLRIVTFLSRLTNSLLPGQKWPAKPTLLLRRRWRAYSRGLLATLQLLEPTLGLLSAARTAADCFSGWRAPTRPLPPPPHQEAGAIRPCLMASTTSWANNRATMSDGHCRRWSKWQELPGVGKVGSALGKGMLPIWDSARP